MVPEVQAGWYAVSVVGAAAPTFVAQFSAIASAFG